MVHITAQLARQRQELCFDIDNEAIVFNLDTINVQARLGSAKRIIDLPNGGRLEAADISELEQAMPSKISIFWRGLHFLENHFGWVLVAILLTIFAGWMFLNLAVPKLAQTVTAATPLSVEAKIGEQVLVGLDSQMGYFLPSQITPQRQAKVAAALNQLCVLNKTCPQYRLEWRNGGFIGANAFALPGGIIVVTDELMKLAKNDQEVMAVLAHELGHVAQRHAFKQGLQGVLAGLILASITGDVSAIASGLPAVLMQMQYSREHELEADRFALDALQKACIPPRVFAQILQRLQSQSTLEQSNTQQVDQSSKQSTRKKPNTTNEKAGFASQILSTHPNMQQRIKPFLQAKQNCK